VFARLEGGAGSLLWFEGPPGIGKSALLAATEGRARAAGVGVCHGTGRELETGFSFGVVLQLLERVLRRLPEEDRDAVCGGAAALARPLLLPAPDDPPVPGAVDRIVHGLFWVVANLAERAPLVLVVDDLHWVDGASLRFLHYLAGRIADLPVAVVGATRPVDAGGLAGSLLATRGSSRRTVGVLSEAAVSELAGGDVGPQLRALLHRLTGGNPLLVHELLENLQAVSERTEDASSVVLPTVLNRLDRLDDGDRRFAQACAVVDDGGSLHLAGELVQRAAADVAAAQERRVAAHVLLAGDVVQFVHPLVRSTVASTLDRIAWGELHGRAASLLDGRGVTAELVAAHLVESPPAGSARAVEVLRLAGRRALRAGMPAQSAAWLRRALAEGADGVDRAELLFDIAVSEAAAGESTWRTTIEDALATRPAATVAARSLLRIGQRLQAAGAVVDAVDVAWRGYGLTPKDDRDLRLELLGAYAGAAVVGLGDRDDAVARVLEGLGDDLRGDDDPARAVLVPLAYDRAIRGGTPGAPSVDDVVALASRAVDGGHARNPILAINALFWSDALDEAWSALETYAASVERRGDVLGRAIVAGYRAPMQLARCCPQAAAADAEMAREGYGLGWRVATPGAAGNLALARLELDDVDGALAALALPPSSPGHAWSDGSPYTYWLFAHGQVLAAHGRWEEALDALLESGARQDAMGSTNPNVFAWRGAAALVAARLGDRAQAASLVADELALARRFGAPRAIASALRVSAAVGSGTGSGASGGRVALLREAASVIEQSPSVLERVRVDVDLGAALRVAGDRVAARVPLRHALDAAERGGALTLARRARDELAAAGAKPRRAALSGPASLTPSERRVAELAARGRRNREIAEELFVTVKAVEFHLGNAYRKLRVSGRDDLSDALSA
jgi:DNA-binding CsgD family transcriptional regulator